MNCEQFDIKQEDDPLSTIADIKVEPLDITNKIKSEAEECDIPNPYTFSNVADSIKSTSEVERAQENLDPFFKGSEEIKEDKTNVLESCESYGTDLQEERSVLRVCDSTGEKSGYSRTMAKAPTLIYRIKEEVPVHSLLCLDPAIKQDTLLTGADDGTVSEWSLNYFRKTETLRIGNSPCMGLKTLWNMLLTQDKEGTVKLWQPHDSNWKQAGAIKAEYTGFAKIDVTKNFGGLVACPTRHSVISVHSVKDGNRVMTLQRDDGIHLQGDVMALKFIDLAQDPFLLVAFESGDVDLYDLKTKKAVSKVKVEDCILSLDFHADSMLGLCGTVGNQIHIFSIDDSMRLGVTRCLDVLNAGIGVIKVISHKKIVVVGGWDGMVRVFALRNLNALGGMAENCSEIRDIEFSTNLMMVADSSGRILFWNI